ncbi:helical backbone metal receptor [Leucothrix pacifica]|uniref:Cobalamin-binding protein n=1 Tax=Leucothrix pacifica TaxID=1247513 RepID=A0A317C1I6_9GAMM|nr:helical backbone metal receptor [Leucothrix pacifica]PWQ92504.1 cobalamin-binding protein [Leucothrix pacifica]
MQREVSLHLPALRIVSLVPSQTELLFAIGAGQSVVGVTKFCTEPPEAAAKVAKIGGTKKFDFGVIAALKPDLIIGNKEENYPAGIDQLAQDYPVWMSDIVTLDDSLAMIRQIGLLSGRSIAANDMASKIETQFDDLRKTVSTDPGQASTPLLNTPAKQFIPLVNVAYFIWQKPYMVAAGGTFIDEVLKLGGMVNVFSGLKRYPEIELESVRDSDAEVVLLSSEPYPFREKHLAAFQQALPDQKIILVDAMPFSWYGSQLLRTAAYLRQLRMQF